MRDVTSNYARRARRSVVLCDASAKAREKRLFSKTNCHLFSCAVQVSIWMALRCHLIPTYRAHPFNFLLTFLCLLAWSSHWNPLIATPDKQLLSFMSCTQYPSLSRAPCCYIDATNWLRKLPPLSCNLGWRGAGVLQAFYPVPDIDTWIASHGAHSRQVYCANYVVVVILK